MLLLSKEVENETRVQCFAAVKRTGRNIEHISNACIKPQVPTSWMLYMLFILIEEAVQLKYIYMYELSYEIASTEETIQTINRQYEKRCFHGW